MKYDEAGREKLFKYYKTRESPSPFVRKESQIQAEAAKAGLENSLATQNNCEGGWLSSPQW